MYPANNIPRRNARELSSLFGVKERGFGTNVIAKYTKPLNMAVYDALPRRADIAKELYCHLDRIAYDTRLKRLRSEVREDMPQLANHGPLVVSCTREVNQD